MYTHIIRDQEGGGVLDMLQKLTSIKHVSGLILEKTTFSALAVDHWQKLPQDIKDLSISNFPRKVKQYLLSKQI